MIVYVCEQEMTVKEAPVGLFLLNDGELICISEYRSGTPPSRDAYIVSSGENYCGEGDNARGFPVKIG